MSDEKLEKTSNNVERDEKGRIIPGQKSLNPKGKPKGTLSFMTRIKQILQDDPDLFEELCRYYITDKRMRDALLKMVDGMPKQSIEHGLDDTVEEIEVTIKKNKDNETEA